MSDAKNGCPRTGKDLVRATRPFAKDSPTKSWWYLGVTLVVLGGLLTVAALASWWPLRAVAAVLAGLVIVRGFILYHDFMHGAILRESRLAKGVFHCWGVLMLTPPRSWRQSHNYHHGHVGKVADSEIGSFPLLTTDAWRKASRFQRLHYRISRHPLTIVCSYLTVFLCSICLQPLLKSPREHWDSAVALVMHVGLIGVLWWWAGFWVLFFAFLLPLWIAAAMGGYLFYSQHNFERMRILPPEQWSYHRAALESSSYLRLGPVMRWFTGNIGYHHVHHLNPTIPFYRLPEAMAAIPELQQPVVTTLRPGDVLASLRLKLWDPERQKMVGYRQATPSN
jgi:omega-6 fatty acid desaturase (delta-12 desaturase)